MFLTFFSNLVLMAGLLGMSVGLLAAARKQDFVAWVMPLAATAVAMAELTGWAYARFGSLIIDVGRQEVSQQVFFGTEALQGDLSTFVVPIEFIAAAFFAAIALKFVGLGQAMGRALAAAPDRLLGQRAGQLDRDRGIWPGVVPSDLSGRVVRGGSGSRVAVLEAHLSSTSLRPAGPDGPAGGRRDARRRPVPDLLVALLQGDISPQERHDRDQ
jgi:hypothetical protein